MISRDSKVDSFADFLFLLVIIRSGLQAGIRWSVCILKSHRSSCVPFSRTYYYYYYLIFEFHFQFPHNFSPGLCPTSRMKSDSDDAYSMYWYFFAASFGWYFSVNSIILSKRNELFRKVLSFGIHIRRDCHVSCDVFICFYLDYIQGSHGYWHGELWIQCLYSYPTLSSPNYPHKFFFPVWKLTNKTLKVNFFPLLLSYCPVCWDCRRHRLLLCRGARPPHPTMSVLFMTLNTLMVCSRNTGALGNAEYPFTAIAPGSTLRLSGSI